MAITDLKAIVAPPKHPFDAGSAGEWLSVEKALGFRFPSDYRELIQSYGAGVFDEYLSIEGPVGRLTTWARDRIEWITCFLHETGKRPDYPFYPHPGGLFPIGQEDNGNYVIHWLMEGEPDDWPIVVLLYRGHVPDWTFDGNLTAFLAALFRMEIDCPIAPHDPSRPIEFEPVEDWGREVPS